MLLKRTKLEQLLIMSSEKWPIAMQVILTGLFVLAGCGALEKFMHFTHEPKKE